MEFMSVQELREFLRREGIEGARKEEERDPQFRALRDLWKSGIEEDRFLTLIVHNSLVCYQLSGRGEDYWREFSEYFQDRPEDGVADFLRVSRFNRRLHGPKLKRLARFNLAVDIGYYERMGDLYRDLADTYGLGKTVSFSVKMYGYGARVITGEFIPYPMEVDMPLDSRILRLSRNLGVKDPKSFWRRLAQEASMPPLHIDSLLWVRLGEKV